MSFFRTRERSGDPASFDRGSLKAPARLDLAAAGLVCLALAACGGPRQAQLAPSTAPAATSSQPPTTVAASNAAQAEPTSTGSPRFTITLVADSHAPSAATPWHYTVNARDRSGRPVGGTAKMRIFAGGNLIDTLGWYGFTGVLHQMHAWPIELRGVMHVVLQAEVDGPCGIRRANWPVRVH